MSNICGNTLESWVKTRKDAQEKIEKGLGFPIIVGDDAIVYEHRGPWQLGNEVGRIEWMDDGAGWKFVPSK